LAIAAGVALLAGIRTAVARELPAHARRPAAAMSASGATVTIQMTGGTAGYKFVPNAVTIKSGDAVTFVNVSGGPHNLSFDGAAIPAGMEPALQSAMANAQGPLIGPMVVAPNATYTISFVGAKPGVYHFYCLPHQTLGMNGTITVE
jgi:plastocyanin